MRGEAMKVLVAGATGALGKQLVPRLVANRHDVFGITRSPSKQDGLRALGARPIVADALDPDQVARAVAQAEPDVIVHELTALSGSFDMRNFDRFFAMTNRLRTEGTDHLLAAGQAMEVRRFVAQGYAGWPYARTGGPVKTEDDPLDPAPAERMSETLAAFRHLEQAVTGAEWTEGVVLRYGGFYGPGTSLEPGARDTEAIRKRKFPIVGSGAGGWSFVHIQDAAEATVEAVEHGRRGIYNVVDDDPAPVAEWLPEIARLIGAKPPRHVPLWLGRLFAGDAGVAMMTDVRGASNAKAKRELGWQPRHPSWRQGIAELFKAQSVTQAAACRTSPSSSTTSALPRSRSPTGCSGAWPRPRTSCRRPSCECIARSRRASGSSRHARTSPRSPRASRSMSCGQPARSARYTRASGSRSRS